MRRFQRRRVPVNGDHYLTVLEGGDPALPSLLFIHGVAGSSGNWSYQLTTFVDRYHVVAPDLRGHGRSPWPGQSTLEDFDKDLDALVEQLPLSQKFVVASHSFGGCLASRLAARYPDRVAGLALINTAGHLPRGPMFRFLLLFSGQADRFRRHYPWMLAAGSEVCRQILYRTTREWDCWSLFPDLAMPSLVTTGALDLLVPVTLARRTAESLPDAEFQLIPSGGHVLMVEHPHQVNQSLESLFQRATDYTAGAFR